MTAQRRIAAAVTIICTLNVGPVAATSRYTAQRGRGICHAAVNELVPAGSLNRWMHRKVDVESSDDPGAWHRNHNGSIDRGCSQINSVHGFPAKCLFNARCNIRAALVVLRKQGRQAWTSPG